MSLKQIAVVDYGMGNIHSIRNAFSALGIQTIFTSDARSIENADAVVIPGVGAFPDAMKALVAYDLLDTLKLCACQKPILGVCLGMQLLFSASDEIDNTKGLDFIPGDVKLISAFDDKNNALRRMYKIPHIGWNPLKIRKKNSPLLYAINDGDCVYFVHSYCAHSDGQYISATAEYGEQITASAERGLIFGTQFHPEKSGDVGLKIIKNFYSCIK